MEAKFFTLEGIEGSGKTTSIKSINRILQKKKNKYNVLKIFLKQLKMHQQSCLATQHILIHTLKIK